MTDSGQFVKAPAMISGQRRSTFRHTETNKAPEPKALTEKDMEFMARMDGDINQRRKNKFVNELRKHPNFRPSMLEPPKSKFKEVSLDGRGPIMKAHNSNLTGRERGPLGNNYQWGPLGGWY